MDCSQIEFFAEIRCWLFAVACGMIGEIINSRPISSENQDERKSRIGLVVAAVAYFSLKALKFAIVNLLK